MTRAFLAMGHFRFREAFFLNPMAPLMFGAVLFIFFAAFYEWIKKKPVLAPFWERYQWPIVRLVWISAALSWTWNLYKEITGLTFHG